MSVNQLQRAARAWPILINRAMERRSITYRDLAMSIELSHHRPIRYVLDEIQNFCIEEKLPPLTILVVDKKGNLGSGFNSNSIDNIEEGKRAVYTHPWQSLSNPFEFAKDGTSVKSISTEIYQKIATPLAVYNRVNNRGMIQRIFRDALLKIYSNRCAISGITLPKLLEVAHIIPWEYADDELRADPTNGILLSTLHHKLFDIRLLSIQEDYKIVSRLNYVKKNSPEYYILRNLNGKTVKLPSKTDFWPKKAYLRKRMELCNF